MAQITTYDGGSVSVGPIPCGRLKNFRNVDKWSYFETLCISLRGNVSH